MQAVGMVASCHPTVLVMPERGRPPRWTRGEALRTVTSLFLSAADEGLTIGGRITTRTSPALVSVG
jgi:hypothetical protein